MNEMRKLMETAAELTEARAINARPSKFDLSFDDEFNMPEYDGAYISYDMMRDDDDAIGILNEMAAQVAPYGLKVYWAEIEELDGYIWKIGR